ncbi:hypothetical protein O7605_20700 [Verrucosispora sp. WMMA2121]|uniref:hypothetical protein n=1 Tax=Verrucosispora sp. WMMA2121 TaxID=3015164 RepID=UPI0022B6257B|nr:hypothetical protein [Verrucosispora sp. WMMA2121]MCZ7421922.1 hypothetical protein [Verrucosispora sp. WMMA2121]
MTVRGGKRWWIVGVVVGLVVFALGGFLAWAGLQDADRWASVIGVFVNVAGLVVAVYSVVQARRTASSGGGPTQTVRNTVTDAEVAGPALLIRDAQRVSLTGTPVTAPVDDGGPDAPAPRAAGGAPGDVDNRVTGGTFGGPLIMGRDLRDIVLPPSLPPPGGQGGDGGGQ